MNITTNNPEEAAQSIFEILKEKYQQDKKVIMALEGDLGAGKTTLVQHVCELFNVRDIVTSPTFSIMNIYEGKLEEEMVDIYHFDWYRLESEQDLGVINIHKILSQSGIFLIEWPSQLSNVLNQYDYLHLTIKTVEGGREYSIL